MIVDRRDVRLRDAADFPHRDLLESTVREQPLGGGQQTLARFLIRFGPARAGRHCGPARRGRPLCRPMGADTPVRPYLPTNGRIHSGRLKSSVAAVMATAEKIRRNVRSDAIATNPVFLSSRFLNAWTAYVKGSATAMTVIQPGKPCCG